MYTAINILGRIEYFTYKRGWTLHQLAIKAKISKSTLPPCVFGEIFTLTSHAN